MKDQDYRDAVPPFDLAGIRTRIRRLKYLGGKFSVESLYVCQQRVPLKPDEITAYAQAMLSALASLGEARAALEKAEARLARIQQR
jgi:hypothetical protein